jgi:hypothetical protein
MTAAVDEDLPAAPDGMRTRVVVTKPYPLAAGAVAIMAEPFAVRAFDPVGTAWIRSWESNTEDPEGAREPDDIHCHATLTDVVITGESAGFRGIYTDGFTPRFELPEGFAVTVAPGERLLFQPMFNNRRPEPRASRMRVRVQWVDDAAARERALRPLRGFTVSVASPERWWIDPFQSDVKTRDFVMPVTGRVHAIGGHLHPHGASIELRRESDGWVPFTARLTKAADLGDARLSTYASREGFAVRAGDRWRVTSLYENPTGDRIDAMAGLFLFYDPDGKPDA